MSGNPPDSTDQDAGGAETDDQRDPRYDDWPIEEHSQASVVGTTGLMGAMGTETVVAYDEETNEIFEATADEERERYVPEDGTRREVGVTETIGEAVEDVGERLGVESISVFARDHLQADPDQMDESDESGEVGHESDADTKRTPDPDAVSFTQSNVHADADHDLEFTGSHTHQAEERAYIVERDFVVTIDDEEPVTGETVPETAVVEVTERVLGGEAPREHQRDGDAEILEEGSTTFTIDLETIEADREVEAVVEAQCEQWHTEHLEPVV